MNKRTIDRRVYGWGLIVHTTPYKGGTLFAELMPSHTGRGLVANLRRLLPGVGNWWYEVQAVGCDNPEDDGHFIEYDGGAFTLRNAMFKAMDAVQKAEESNE